MIIVHHCYHVEYASAGHFSHGPCYDIFVYPLPYCFIPSDIQPAYSPIPMHTDTNRYLPNGKVRKPCLK